MSPLGGSPAPTMCQSSDNLGLPSSMGSCLYAASLGWKMFVTMLLSITNKLCWNESDNMISCGSDSAFKLLPLTSVSKSALMVLPEETAKWYMPVNAKLDLINSNHLLIFSLCSPKHLLGQRAKHIQSTCSVTCADCAAAAALLLTFAGIYSTLWTVGLLIFRGFILVTKRVIDVPVSSNRACEMREFHFEELNINNSAPNFYILEQWVDCYATVWGWKANCISLTNRYW